MCTATSSWPFSERRLSRLVWSVINGVKIRFTGYWSRGRQYEAVLSYVDIARPDSAELVEGGGEAYQGGGYFVKATFFGSVRPSIRIYEEEIFDPFVVIATFEDENEAIDMFNDSIYGLGMMCINRSQNCNDQISFGGVQQSESGTGTGTFTDQGGACQSWQQNLVYS